MLCSTGHTEYGFQQVLAHFKRLILEPVRISFHLASFVSVQGGEGEPAGGNYNKLVTYSTPSRCECQEMKYTVIYCKAYAVHAGS